MTTEDKTSSLLSNQYTGVQRIEALKEEVVEEKSETPQEEPSDENKDTVDWQKRYSDLRSHSDKRDNEYKNEIVTLKHAANEATPNWTPPSTDEEMEEFKSNHPDVWNIVETIAHNQAEDATKEAKELRRELQEATTASQQREGAIILQRNHPDYYDVYGSEEFQAWKDKQPKNVQEWAGTESDGELASRVLDLYKLDAGLTSSDSKVVDRKKLKEDASKLVSNQAKGDSKEPKDKPSFSRRQIEAMNINEYEANEEAIMVARQEGRIVDDKR